MYLKQISIYLENVKGSLLELTQLLGENNINLLAMSVADTSGFGIVRCITKSGEIEPAINALKAGGYVAKTNNVICLRIPHKPCGLASALKVLESNDIAVEYTYSFCRSTLDDAVLILRPSDKDKAVKAFAENGISMISQEEVDQF